MFLEDLMKNMDNKYGVTFLKCVLENIGKWSPVYLVCENDALRGDLFKTIYEKIPFLKKEEMFISSDVDTLDWEMLKNIREVKKQIIIGGKKEIEEIDIDERIKSFLSCGYIIRIYD